MSVRSTFPLFLALALAGCDLIGSDPGTFEATLTASDGTRTTLQGSAVYEVQEGGATILLLPRDRGLDTEIRLQLAELALAEGSAPVGDDVRLSYVIRNAPPRPVEPGNPPPPSDGGALVYEGEAGTVTLARLTGSEAEGRIEASIAADGGEPLALRSTFRAVAR